MSHWEPNNQICSNCEYPKLKQLSDLSPYFDDQDAELILWCPDCGSLLLANRFDPISLSDWRVPKLNELNRKGHPNSRRAIG